MAVNIPSLAISAGELAGVNLLNSLYLRPQRQFGAMRATITHEERQDDELHITEQPVQQGAAVTDHAFKLPSRLSLDVGWSASDVQASLPLGGLTLLPGGNDGYPQQIYQQLRDLQISRVPFNVVTGKYSYANMLLRRIHVTTDKRREFILEARLDFQMVIIVSPITSTVAGSPAANLGTQQPKIITNALPAISTPTPVPIP